mmetsp:Transcript_29508/g.57888  ORF Transcript_29508/g.57888 Transcript_29508/m.57888 type:complete len:214 (-) Transcript_29508:627-1268(-)
MLDHSPSPSQQPPRVWNQACRCTSAALGRCPGSRASIVWRRLSAPVVITPPGTINSADMIANCSMMLLSSQNGQRPKSITKRMQPKDHTSRGFPWMPEGWSSKHSGGVNKFVPSASKMRQSGCGQAAEVLKSPIFAANGKRWSNAMSSSSFSVIPALLFAVEALLDGICCTFGLTDRGAATSGHPSSDKSRMKRESAIGKGNDSMMLSGFKSL